MIEQAFLRNTKALTEVKHILSIMHSFTNIHELGFKDLVEPENVESSYLAWLKLYRKWDGNERSFYSPDWFPLSTSNYDYFIVLNSSVHPIIYTSIKLFDNSDYEKYIYFYQALHLMVLLDSTISLKEIHDEFQKQVLPLLGFDDLN